MSFPRGTIAWSVIEALTRLLFPYDQETTRLTDNRPDHGTVKKRHRTQTATTQLK